MTVQAEQERDSAKSLSTESLVSGSYKPRKIEALVRSRWASLDVRGKIEQKQAHQKKVGYVEGPPTLNGEPHMGHLRGRLMKDLWYRFTTLRGEAVDFRGGWDCQGLPVELTAEKELGLTGNKTANLKKIGEEAFVEACKKTLVKYHGVWKEADDLLGLMINDAKAYYTYHDKYIEREWQYLRSAWQNKILDEGYRVTPFCPSCQTSLSAAEVALGGYEKLEDPSMYFKIKVRDQRGTYLAAWTTMPFTVVTDELVGVKPESDYCYVKLASPERSQQETWIVGAGRVEPLMQELHIENYSIDRRVKGRELEGLRYDHPLADLVPEQDRFDSLSPVVHSVVAEEFVDDTTGSGLVHMAPVNGEDDFEVSQRRKVPVYNPIDGQAVFTKEAGVFAGLFVRDADAKVRDALKQKSLLLKYGRLKHDYPVCWRSGHRLVWLARREYFYFVDRLGDMAVDAGEKAEYFYEQPRNRFIEIIREKRPWCISRERVWGNPLPIWRCPSCKEKLGLFSRREIVEHSNSLPDGENFELHRPWIDRVKIPCPKCKSMMEREPFVLDTWHNSGAAPYASLSDKEYKEYVPVPFLTEGIDQTRGWAYSLLIENVLLSMKAEAPFEHFLFQGFVLDEDGEKLSKSKANYIPVLDLLKRESVDLTRFYLIWKGSPIDSIVFSLKEMSTRSYQVLNTLYNMHLFYLQNTVFDAFKLDVKEARRRLTGKVGTLKKQDRWLLSRLESLIDLTAGAYTSTRYHEVARAIEGFLIEDVSQSYVPLIRSEMWQEDEEAKTRRQQIYSVLGYALYECDKILHPISPYVTDFLSSECFGTTFLLLEDWPSSKSEFKNDRLEAEFDVLAKMISLTNSARMKGKLKRRWPLKKAYYLASKEVKDLALANKDLFKEQTNLEDIEIESNPSLLPLVVTAKPNYELLAPRAKQKMSELARAISKADGAKLFSEISENGKTKLSGFEDVVGDIGPGELEFSFSASENSNLIVAENFGIVVALDVSRDESLIAKGFVRDLARNLQSLRKERKYNPTDILEKAEIYGLSREQRSMLEGRKEELAFLVRVKVVVLSTEKPDPSAGWMDVDIDDAAVYLKIA